jgi:long-chain acyl-CoA synthetase
MDAITDRLAAGLTALGVEKGDRVGIFMPNTPQFVMAFFGILKVGGIVVATNPLYSEREIEHQANDSGVEIMLVMSNFYNTIKKVQKNTKIKTLIVTNIKETLPPVLAFLFGLTKEKKGGFKVQLQEGDIWLQDMLERHSPEQRLHIEVGADDMALFQYTGGTTGVPKGAIGLHLNLIANSYQVGSWIPEAKIGQEVFLMAIPLFHVYGMVAGMCFAIRLASSMVMIPNPRDLKDVLDSIQKYNVTVYPGVPAMYNAINNHPDVQAGKYNLSSITACISGSAPLLRETKERFEALTGGKLVEGYGLSETPTATHCNPLHGKSPPGSIGLPFPDVEARIISLDDEVTVLGVDEIGELVIKGPQVMYGYHNMPTETANTLRDDWLYGGYQVWPRTVEEAIAENPKVLEVGVAGIPDPYRGETVKAWVVLIPGETATEEEIKDWCRDRLAKYEVPTQVEFRDELPKTTVGKILRRELVAEEKAKAE